MKITNRENLPLPLYRAVSHQRPRVPKRISATELIQPPQIRQLLTKHWDAIEEDASDRLWSALGTLMHKLMEEHAEGIEGHLSEHRMETKVDDYAVSGILDLLNTHTKTLFDYKFVSVWSAIDGVKPEWVQQLNIYAALARRSGQQVESAHIVAIYRDWSKNKASQDTTYPQSQVKVFDLELWPESEAERFLIERVRLHAKADGGEYPECTPAERWERPGKIALMKAGQKRAVKLFDSKPDMDAYQTAFGLSKGYYGENRPGSQVRCESYCACAPWCPTFARLRNE